MPDSEYLGHKSDSPPVHRKTIKMKARGIKYFISWQQEFHTYFISCGSFPKQFSSFLVFCTYICTYICTITKMLL